MYGSLGEDGLPHSELVIGRWLAARGLRKECTLISKGAFPAQRVTPECIAQDLDESLAALAVEQIDVYLLHRDSPSADLLGIMTVLTAAVKAGKIRAFGASNWTLKRMAAANKIAAAHGLLPFAIAQEQWSLAQSDPEVREIGLVYLDDDAYLGFQQEDIPLMAYASQGKGIFSQLIAGGEEAIREKARRYLTDTTRKRAAAVQKLSQQYEVSPAAVAIAYIRPLA